MRVPVNGQAEVRTLLFIVIAITLLAAMFVAFVQPLAKCIPVMSSLKGHKFLAFDSAVWRTHRELRASMLYDLLFWHRLDNLTRLQVIALLGAADGPLISSAGAPGSSNDTYLLSGMDYMKVDYDSKGRVTAVTTASGSH